MSVKISELTAASALTGAEEVPLVQSSTTKKVTVNDLLPVQLQGDKTIDLNGHSLVFEQGATSILNINTTADQVSLNSVGVGSAGSAQLNLIGLLGEEGASINVLSSESSTTSTISVYADTDNGYKFYLTSDNSTHTVEIEGNSDENTLEYTAGNHIFPELVAKDFVNDTAAATGLVPVGGLYHTMGVLKIRLT